MQSGTYLRLRRRAAGLARHQVAAALAAMPWALRAASAKEIVRLASAIEAVENGRSWFTAAQLDLLRGVFPFSRGVHAQLVERESAARGTLRRSLPRICCVCACTDHDACREADGSPCAWANAGGHGEDLCTRCAVVLSAEAELAAGPIPPPPPDPARVNPAHYPARLRGASAPVGLGNGGAQASPARHLAALRGNPGQRSVA